MNRAHSFWSRATGRSRRMLAALSMLALLAAGCRRETVSGPDGGNGEFPLRVGQYRLLERGGPSLGFRRMVTDSRCPTHVVCVWAGEGRVQIAMVAAPEDTTFLELSTQGPHQQGEALGYRIKVERLEPYPEESGAIPEADYRLVLTATKI